MKKYLVVFLALIAAFSLAHAEADPGQLYADAFILLQDGQAAEQKSDWGIAFQKYNAASEILRNLRKDVPDWNPHVVEFRLKDITEKLDAVRGKVPTPVLTAPPVVPSAPAPAIVMPMPVPVPVPVVANPEVDRLKGEVTRLTGELEAAKKTAAVTPRAEKQIANLKHENQQLVDQAETRDHELAALKQKLAAKPVESPELKKVRSELADSKAEVEKAHAAQQREVAKLQQDNKDLSGQLDAAKKQAAAKPVESPELKKLRAELTDTKADAEKVRTAQQEQIKELTSQVSAAKKAAAMESPELKKVRSELADAKAEVEKAHASDAKLKQENQELATQLAAAKKATVAKSTADTAATANADEVKKLREELAHAKAEVEIAAKTTKAPVSANEELAQLRPAYARAKAEAEEYKRLAARAEIDRAERAASGRRIEDLNNSETALRSEVAKLKKQLADKGSVPAVESEKPKANVVTASPANNGSEEIAKLRRELAAARADADKARQAGSHLSDLESENQHLTAQVAEAKKQADAKAATAAAELKKAREDAGRVKADEEKSKQAELAQLQKQNTALAAQLESAKKAAGAPPVVSADLKKSQADLADAKVSLDKTKNELAAARKANQDEIAALQGKNKALVADLEAAKNQSAKAEEITKLRKQADAALADAEKYKQAAKRVGALEAENQALAAKLDAAKKASPPVVKPTAPTAQNFGPAVSESDAARSVLEKQIADLQKQNTDLKAQLKKLQP